jgi:error-prone DNA polymerase
MVQWDKDSCADAGFLKIDLLGLGMLSAVEDCVEQIAREHGTMIDLSRVPLDDQGVYDEIQRADTVGTFQIESRAQMQTLLRTRPENLDDLTIQVAIMRPGPIQSKSVHPFIDRRQKLREDPSYVPPVEHPLLAEPLRETLGTIIFQDQVLEVAMAVAGFSIGEAEGLRRALSRKRSEAAIEAFRGRFVDGALCKGLTEQLAHEIYDKVRGFAGFGFPKSHSAAFALLAYQSQWLRHHYPAEFLCALLNEQPMGFYPPASLVRDAQRRGVEVRPPDVNASGAKARIETGVGSTEPAKSGGAGFAGSGAGKIAVRVGLEYVQSIGKGDAQALVTERDRNGAFKELTELAQRAPREVDVEALVKAGACDCFGRPRRELLWELGLVPRSENVPGSGGEERQLALPLEPTVETPELREQTPWEKMLADYRTTSLSVGVHPLELLRTHLPHGVLSSTELAQCRHGRRVRVAGMAVARQRPSTAKGVVFMLLEDEHGQMNLIIPPHVYERHRALVRGEPLLLAQGRFERRDRNMNVLVDKVETLGPLAREVAELNVRDALPRAHHFGHR